MLGYLHTEGGHLSQLTGLSAWEDWICFIGWVTPVCDWEFADGIGKDVVGMQSRMGLKTYSLEREIKRVDAGTQKL